MFTIKFCLGEKKYYSFPEVKCCTVTILIFDFHVSFTKVILSVYDYNWNNFFVFDLDLLPCDLDCNSTQNLYQQKKLHFSLKFHQTLKVCNHARMIFQEMPVRAGHRPVSGAPGTKSGHYLRGKQLKKN